MQIPEPFWEDEPATGLAANTPSSALYTTFLRFGATLMLFTALFSVGLFFAFALRPIGWLWIGLIVYGFAASLIQRRRRQARITAINAVQARARERTRASCIGSAIHVAGHPLLARDQPVVLALANDALSIYNFNNATPIDSLPLAQLQAANTVVYDDERVPHWDVIDSAAQALQLIYIRDGESWKCLFRQMRKARAIDWYHAIQQARLSAKRNEH